MADAQQRTRHHPRKTADVDFKAYQSDHQIQRFSALRVRLSDVTKVKDMTEAQLSLLTAHLIQCNEETLGRRAPLEKREITKLPVRLFRDYSESGSLYHLLYTYWRIFHRFTFNQSSAAEHLRMLKEFQRILVAKGYLTYPRIFLHDSVGEERPSLDRILRKHKAVLVGSPRDATHIIHGTDGEMEHPEDEPEFIRVIEKQTSFVLVHWWYYPDSYDAWIDSAEVDLPDIPRPRARVTPYHVTARFVRDLERFNEWMNVLDYAVEELSAPAPAVGEKRQMAQSEGSDAKRVKTGEGEEQRRSVLAHPEPQLTHIPTDAALLKTRTPSVAGPIPGGYAECTSTSSGSLLNATHMAGIEEGDTASPMKGADGQNQARVPWFDAATVHAAEKRAIPEFFDGRHPSKTPALYKEYRDFMIDTYEKNPDVYLTQTACRRSLAGDVCSILRLHECLEHWGLINYKVTPDLFPVGAPTLVSAGSALKDLLRLSKTPSRKRDVLDAFAGRPKAAVLSMDTTVPATYALRPNIYEGGAQIKCESCDELCSVVRYHCLKNPDLNICPSCFSNGKYDTHLTSVNFVKVQNPSISLENGWTDQETLLLLKGIEQYPDDWEAVAAFVGTKTANECVMHFLRMPIEDDYLEPPLLRAKKEKEKDAEDGKNEILPFMDSANPVLALVAFLADSVHPEVAAAAANGALAKIREKRAEAGAEAASKSGEKAVGSGTAGAPAAAEEAVAGAEREAKEGGPGAAMEVEASAGSGEQTDEKKDEAEGAAEKAEGDATAGAEAASGSEATAGAAEANGDAAQAVAAAALNEDVEVLAGAAIGSVAARAKCIAEQEEQRIQRLVMEIIDAQMKKVAIKLQAFEVLEQDLEKELRQVEQARVQLQHASTQAKVQLKAQQRLLESALAEKKARERGREQASGAQQTPAGQSSAASASAGQSTAAADVEQPGATGAAEQEQGQQQAEATAATSASAPDGAASAGTESGDRMDTE